jgi:RNA polymerase sigma-70 factor (ECF subfamily)
LDCCLAKLTDRSRKLLHMRYFEDLPPQQIGIILGMASQSVRVSLSRIRTALSECVLHVIDSTAVSDG